MNRWLSLEGFFWVLLGASLGLGALGLKLGTLQKPGPGFLPLVAGCLLALLGAILSFAQLSKKTREEAPVQNVAAQHWRVFLLTLAALFGYILLLNHLGFILTTFLFLFFLFKLTAPRKWLSPVIFSGSTVVLSYFLFYQWLKVQFPRGIWGF